MNRLCLRLVIALLIIPLGGKVSAEEKLVKGKFVVSLSADAKQHAWVVNALEQNIYNDLSGYERVVPFNKAFEKEKTCKHRDIDCILEIYKNLNVDALMFGTVDRSDINYQIYDVQNKFLISSGSIDIGSGSSLLKLRMGAFNAFKPFIEKGGILEKRSLNETEEKSESTSKGDSLVAKDDIDKKLKLKALLYLSIFTAFPYLYSFIGKPRRNQERSRIILRCFYPFLLLCLSPIGYIYYLISTGMESQYQIIINQFFSQHWIITALGGIAWALFLIINYKIVMPHLQGIERVKPSNLFPLLKSCLLTLIIKTLLFSGLYIPFFYGIYYLGLFFSVNQETILLLVFPLSGIYIYCWVALLLDVFSMSIDVKLSEGNVDFKNVWNLTVRKYFIAYLKRNGVSINKRLVRNIVFLPGKNKGVVCYGGGFSKPRITINKDMIKFALGAIDEFNPQETGIFARRVFQPIIRKNSVFRIIPNLPSQDSEIRIFKKRHDGKRESALDKLRQQLESDLRKRDSDQNYKLENIMQGIILPKLESIDPFPPLMSDNYDDMQVVEQLLLENAISFDPYDEEAEIDDANEHDKDFLFGALLHKFGAFLRHEDIFSTVYLYFHREKGEKKRPYNFPYSKYFAMVADTFVVLNFGLNHLLQHLYYQITEDDTPLTTKGDPSGMLVCQDLILTEAKSFLDERKRKTMQTDELDRMVWLSRFSQEPLQAQSSISPRSEILIKGSIFLLFIYFSSRVVMNAYNYHPKYISIIENEKQEIAKAIEKEREKERKQR